MVLRKSKRRKIGRGLAALALVRAAAAALPGAKRRRERRRRRALALGAVGAASAGVAGALARRRRTGEQPVAAPVPPPPTVTNLGPVPHPAPPPSPAAGEQHPAYEAPLGGEALPGETAEALAAPDDSSLLDVEPPQAEVESLEQALEPEALDFPPSEPNQSASGSVVPPPRPEVRRPHLVDPDLPNEGAPGSAPTVGADAPLEAAPEDGSATTERDG